MGVGRCAVAGCPGVLEVRVGLSGRTWDECPCCIRRRRWERAGAPELVPERVRCVVCDGVFRRTAEGHRGNRNGRWTLRCAACRDARKRAGTVVYYRANAARIIARVNQRRRERAAEKRRAA